MSPPIMLGVASAPKIARPSPVDLARPVRQAVRTPPPLLVAPQCLGQLLGCLSRVPDARIVRDGVKVDHSGGYITGRGATAPYHSTRRRSMNPSRHARVSVGSHG